MASVHGDVFLEALAEVFFIAFSNISTGIGAILIPIVSFKSGRIRGLMT